MSSENIPSFVGTEPPEKFDDLDLHEQFREILLVTNKIIDKLIDLEARVTALETP